MKQTNSLISLLKQIQIHSKSLTGDTFAYDNLMNDLKHIHLRLKTNMYAESDYEKRDIFDVPRRTEEFLRYFSGYDEQGEFWASILKPLITTKTKTILDVCPGWAPKIELGLWKLRFKGTTHLVDYNPSSLSSIESYLKMIGSDLKLVNHNDNFFYLKSLPQMDLIVGNHIVDDLLLHEYCEKSQVMITSLYESENAMLKATEEILKLGMIDQKVFADSVSQVIISLMKQNSYIVLSQYKGLFERTHRLTEWSNFVGEIFRHIESNLLKAELNNQIDQAVSDLSDKQKEKLIEKNLIVMQMI